MTFLHCAFIVFLILFGGISYLFYKKNEYLNPSQEEVLRPLYMMGAFGSVLLFIMELIIALLKYNW